MARKQVLPTDQLDRLNERYRRERDALVALTNARVEVGKAADRVGAARDALEQARRRERDAYQDVVALVGAAAAAELSGGVPDTKTSRRRRTASGARRSAAVSAGHGETNGDRAGG